MKVLVTGGAGYIGSHAVYELIRNGNEVVVIDNLSTGNINMVHEEATFYKCDIRNYGELVDILNKEKKIDVVMHFAGKIIVPESVEEPLEYYHNNVEGVRILLEAMKSASIKNIVFSSTAAVYGDTSKSECKEEDYKSPINPYGETKLAAENLIKWSASAYDLNYCIFRYFNVAGADKTLEIGLENDKLTHLIPITNQAALGLREKVVIMGTDYKTPDGTCIRDFIHVTDLVKAHILGAEYIGSENKSGIFNLGSNNGYSVKEVVELACSINSFKYENGDKRAGDPAKLIASNGKVKQVLGWKPELSLFDMIKSDYDFRARMKNHSQKEA